MSYLPNVGKPMLQIPYMKPKLPVKTAVPKQVVAVKTTLSACMETATGFPRKLVMPGMTVLSILKKKVQSKPMLRPPQVAQILTAAITSIAPTVPSTGKAILQKNLQAIHQKPNQAQQVVKKTMNSIRSYFQMGGVI